MAGLGINIGWLLSQTVNFFILLALLYLVAYKPILKMLDARSRKIKESLDQAENTKTQMTPVEEEVKKRLDAATKQEMEILSQANKSADEIRNKILENAKHEAEAIIARVQINIKEERKMALEQMREEVADLIVQASSKVINRTLDKKAHLDIINNALDEIDTLKLK